MRKDLAQWSTTRGKEAANTGTKVRKCQHCSERPKMVVVTTIVRYCGDGKSEGKDFFKIFWVKDWVVFFLLSHLSKENSSEVYTS